MIEEHPDRNLLVGFYRGQVIKQCKHGKCKIWIPSVYPIEWRYNPDLIPDAEQAAPLFGGSVGGNGLFSWPDIGAIVWCFFQNGDQNLPVYFAASLGGIDAHDQYVQNRNSDSKFLQKSDEDADDSAIEKSRVHKINIGKTSVSLTESGTLSAATVFPLTSSSGTMAANCTYAEYLLHFYGSSGSKSLWLDSDIMPIENDQFIRLGLSVNKDGAVNSFKSAFKADADAKPPKIDVFFYAEASGSKQNNDEEDETDKPPVQDTTFEKQKTDEKHGLYFCTVGLPFDKIENGPYDYYNNNEVFKQQLEFAAKEKYELFVCQADQFFETPIIQNYDIANKREISIRKNQVQNIIDKLASEYGISILAICPKHTFSKFSINSDGYMHASALNDFTQIKTDLHINVDGSVSAYTGHIMSADMLSQDTWDNLGQSFSRASIDSAGNTFLDGVYTTKNTEVSCIFDMTTKEHIKAELNALSVDDGRNKKKAVVCSYDCDTLSGIADLSVVFYDFESGDKTYSRVRMTKDGEISVNCTQKLDVLVKEDKGHTHSHIMMHENGKMEVDCTDSLDVLVKKENGQNKSHMRLEENGNIGIDSSKSIDMQAPDITITGNKINITGKSKTSIAGQTGDCKIYGVSLVNHIHQCGSGTTNIPIKQ